MNTRIETGLRLLDLHYSYIKDSKNERERTEQKAYYDGLRTMLEIIVSDNYREHYHINRDKCGHHNVSRYEEHREVFCEVEINVNFIDYIPF